MIVREYKYANLKIVLYLNLGGKINHLSCRDHGICRFAAWLLSEATDPFMRPDIFTRRFQKVKCISQGYSNQSLMGNKPTVLSYEYTSLTATPSTVRDMKIQAHFIITHFG